VDDHTNLASRHALLSYEDYFYMKGLKSKAGTALCSAKWRTMKPASRKHEAVRRFVAAIAFLFAVLPIISGAWPFQNPQATCPGTESITIGVPPLESTALIYIAEDQHFFADNGLNVTIRDYEPAIAGVDGLLKGEVDLAGASEYAVVVNVFKKENINIIVSGDEVQANYLIGRKDRGIENVSDLRGKKIGTPLGTNAEFYLGRFLNLHGIDPRDVITVNVRPPQFVNATLNGDVDAIICWQPYVSQTLRRRTPLQAT
jgi:NitT/TauT family transport system substrate-binding protein